MTITKIIAYIFLTDKVKYFKQAGVDSLFCCLPDFVSNNGFNIEELEKLVEECNKNLVPLYVSSPANDVKIDLPTQINLIQTLSSLNIEGFIIEDYGLLSLLASTQITETKKIVLGPTLNIHNVETVNLLSKFNPFAFLINEEILLKNVSRIKKLSKQKIWIDINHSSPLIKFVVRWGIDFIRINSTKDFDEESIKSINILKNILNNTKQGKNPEINDLTVVSKTLESINYTHSYKINHFSRNVSNKQGKIFNLNENIRKSHWNNYLDDFIALEKPIDIKQNSLNVRIRLSKLSQVNLLKHFQDKHKVSIVNIIEFGDIISSADIAQNDFTNIIKSVKNICQEMNLELYITTPKVLIERDFERLVNAASKLCLDQPQPNALIVNNPGLFKILSNNQNLINFNIEAGEGININNRDTFRFFKNIFPINGAYFSIENLNHPNKYIKDLEINKKSTLLIGISKIASYGMCPINTDMPYSSSLDCNAACQHGTFSLFDPYQNEEFPMILDGFCRPHLITNRIQNNLNSINTFVNAGITDLIIDCRGLPDNITKSILEIFLNSIKCHVNV